MIKIVLDTNVLLVSISSRSKLHWLFQLIIQKKITLCVTTDILLEYAEVIERHLNKEVAESILAVIENLENVEFVNSYYKFDLLKDKDDNKFSDCAIAAGANYIISHDKDFRVLDHIDFPKVVVLNAEQFKSEINNS